MVCFNIKKWGPRCVRSLPVAVVAVLVVPVSWVSHGGLEHTWRQKHSAFSLHAGLTNHRSAVYTCVQSHLSESSGSSCGSCVGGSRLVGLTRWIWAGVTDRKWRNRSRLLSWGLVGAHLRREEELKVSIQWATTHLFPDGAAGSQSDRSAVCLRYNRTLLVDMKQLNQMYIYNWSHWQLCLGLTAHIPMWVFLTVDKNILRRCFLCNI